MEDNVLKVKLVADASDYKKDMKDAGEATEKFGDESKKSSTALEKLQKTINEQKTRLKALKDEYTDLVLAQDKSDKSTKDLENKMKLLNAQLLINEKRLQAANAASNSFTSGLGASDQTSESMRELYDTMESIRNLQFADLIFNSNFGEKVKDVKEAFGGMAEHLRDAKEHLKEASGFIAFLLNPKNAKEAGVPYFKGLFDKRNWDGSMGGTDALASLKAAAASAGQGFKALGGVIKNAMTGAVAAIASVIAVVVSLVTAIKNAIRTARELKTQFFNAQKIGMSNASYEEWGYIMGQVGIEADKLSDFLRTLADEQNNVRDGSEDTIKAFKELGLSVEEVSTMSQEKLFTETVKRLQ